MVPEFRSKSTSAAGPWLLLGFAMAALIAAQYLFTRAALPRVLYEELAESIRNPYWLSERHMYNQWSSNVGWYGLLTGVYYALGFEVFMAKWVRLALHALSLVFLAAVLVRWRGLVQGTALLVISGLSSTWLYCNTYQTSYGIDLQFVPVLLFLMLPTLQQRTAYEGQALGLGLLFSFASLCYPTAIFYLPCAVLLAAYGLWRANPSTRPGRLCWIAALFAIGFYLPVGCALSYLVDPDDLLNGLFQGGGAGLQPDLSVVLAGIGKVATDLFIEPASYCFDLPHVEFSNRVSSVLFAATVCGAIGYLLLDAGRKPLRDSPYVVGMGISLFVMTWFIVVPNLVPNAPGIRRSTGFLVGYYALLSCLAAVLWDRAYRPAAPRLQPLVAWMLLGLHLVASGLTLSRNIATYPAIAARHNEPWIMIQGNPRDSLEYWFQQTRAGRPFECAEFDRQCRYALWFAAVRAQQRWNGREPFPIYAVDPGTKTKRELSLSIWEQWEWPH